MIKVPIKEDFTNWKIRPFTKWLNYQCPQAWQLGCSVAVDEMNIRLKGHNLYKLRITYKSEGDGFQTDTLCDDGYFYQVYMQNEPSPKKYLKQGLSPLHYRTMALFHSLKEDHHQAGMDNLYNYADFYRANYQRDLKVLCHSVA